MLIIPIQSVPSQSLTVQLAGQVCGINIYQKYSGLYLDLYVNNVLIIGGVICENLNRIVRSAYLGFIGDLTFIDLQGADDPSFDPPDTTLGGLGTRFQLAYLEVSDLA